MVHWPANEVRGAALICPPIGYENVCAHQSLRQLGDQLCDEGIVTMRIDYDGTGNSIGHDREPSRIDAWTQTIRDALDELHYFDVGRPVVIGMRLGAALAATCLDAHSGVAGVVFWDPILDGRRYSRVLELLSSTIGSDKDNSPSAVIGGIHFTSETLAEIASLRVDAGCLPPDGFVVERIEQESNTPSLPDGWSLTRMDGMSALLDNNAELSVVPRQIIRTIADWTADHAAAPSSQPSRPTFVSTCSEQVGSHLLEHELARLGTGELFAVRTRLKGSRPRTAVIMLNNGVAASIGPGRAWIDLAHRLALDGHEALRLDLSGLGDSPPRPGRSEQDDYSPEAGRDLFETVTLLAGQGVERVACVGLCSGALLSFDGAMKIAEIDVLVSINGRFDRPFHDRRGDRGERAARQTMLLAAIPLHKTPLAHLFNRIPEQVWRLLDRVHAVALPTHALSRYLRRASGTVLLIFGTGELGLQALRSRAGSAFTEIVRHRRVTLVEFSELDHSMFDPQARERVLSLVVTHLKTALAPESGQLMTGASASSGSVRSLA